MDSSMFANMPLAAPPKGQLPDFDSPAPAAHVAWALDIISLVLCFLTVVIRLYVKRFVSKQKVTWDDGSCVAALCIAVIHTGVTLNDLNYGLGKYLHNIRVASMTTEALLAMTSANLIITVNMFFVRLSVLGLYYRLFRIYDVSRRLIYVGFVVSVMIAIPEAGVAIGRMAKCHSVLAGLTTEYCFKRNTSIAVTTFAIAACILDVFIYSIAISRLRLLHVQRNKKIQLMVVFAIGFLAVAFSFTNFVFNVVNSKTSEQMWYALWVSIFKVLEANIALMCACATFLPAFWKSIFSRSQVSTSKTSYEAAGSGPVKNRVSDDDLDAQKFDSLPELAPVKTPLSDRSRYT